MSAAAGWRWTAATVMAATLAACGAASGVHSRSADRAGSETPTPATAIDAAPADPRPAPTEPAPTPPAPDRGEATTPTDTATEESGSPAGTAPATTIAPSPDDLVGAGDTLYPDLGNPGLDVQSYVVRITYDPADAVIHGHVTLTTRAADDLDQIVLDAGAMTISEVRVDGVDAPFEKRPDELVIDAPAAADQVLDLDVVYEDAPDSGAGALLDVGWFATPNGSYVLNEPDALHTWMPAVDHPADKASWRFEITVPDGLTGVANGLLVSQTTADGMSTWIWEQPEPMSTYLVQLLTGEYVVLDGGHAGTVPLVNVALAADAARMAPYFDITAEQMAFFEEWFGPYPLTHYGLAFTESYPGLAMETQGRSMYSRVDFTGRLGIGEQLLLSHELAHQWFGDAVSPADWGALWLNESLATYGQWMWFEEIGLDTVEDQAAVNLSARRYVAIESTGRPSVENLFGFERYDGGAVVAHALRLTIGDDAFFTLLQRWVAEHYGTSRSTDDFVALAEEIAGRDLTAFFDTWLYSVELPAAYPT